MTKIDPEEDQLVTFAIELGANIFESLILITDAPEEYQEMISDIKMQLQLIGDEILQLSPEARTRENIRLSVIGAKDRLGEKYPIVEEATDAFIDSLCNLFELLLKDDPSD